MCVCCIYERIFNKYDIITAIINSFSIIRTNYMHTTLFVLLWCCVLSNHIIISDHYYPISYDKFITLRMKILCQGREDNPVHTDAFNVLIKSLKEKNPKWNRTILDCERLVTRTLFMEENSDGERLYWYLRQKTFNII